jgi:DNA modification methylase
MLVCGDARYIPIRSESVQCVVTSPPYWGLRDYGTARWEGGTADCNHTGIRRNHGEEKQGTNGGSARDGQVSRDCRLCGARRIDTQIGLESTPEAYVAEMVAVFREVWRVLRKDGTVFLNLGDSYAGSWSGNSMRPNGGSQRPGGPGFQPLDERVPARSGIVPAGLKPKDLVGIPWRVAFALQADGWYLRSDIIWSKPNPMPESVTDRPTKAHEYVFLLTKSEKYFYDGDAIREPHKVSLDVCSWDDRKAAGATSGNVAFGQRVVHGNDVSHDLGNLAGRNRRSVWEVATEPYAGAHFATFPRKLIEPMILAGSRLGDIVLDPFCGSGTTQLVARELGRIGIGLDLKYQDLAAERISGGPLLSKLVNVAPFEVNRVSGREFERVQTWLPIESSQDNRSES